MAKKIDVVFMLDVESVAKKGERKQVAGGFWRHYLLPRGLALPSSDKRAKALAARHLRRDSVRNVGENQSQPPMSRIKRRPDRRGSGQK